MFWDRKLFPSLDWREPGATPYTCWTIFPDDFLLVIDESHVTVPQIRGMYNGDRARKEVLDRAWLSFTFCRDNRPLRFEEFEEHIHQVIYVSATPGPYELEKSRSSGADYPSHRLVGSNH